MVRLLTAGKFDDLARSVSNKVSDLLDCETITALVGHAGEKTVQMYLEAELIKLAGNFNGNPALNLKDYQVPIIAEMLIQNYKWESAEDFTLCFRRASCGFYGEIYRIDGAVIGQWMSRYLEEKYDALEQRKAKEKQDDKKPVSIVKLTAEHAEEYGKRYVEGDKKKPDNSKENAYQREKLNNPPRSTPIEKVIARDKFIRECQERALRDKYPKATDEEINKILENL